MLRPLLLLRTCLAALAVTLGLATLPARLAAQPASTPPACKGSNLTETLSRENGAAWARVSAAAEATANAKALLWKLEKPGVPPSHLFGTVHLTDERVTTLPPATEAALKSAKTVALEIADLSPAAMGPALAALQSLLVYGDGRSLERQLDEAEKKTARTALERAGVPPAALAALRPWFVGMLLALSDCERRRGTSGVKPLDAQLGDTAKGLGIPVVGLETLADQLRAMARVPEDDQLVMLKASLKLYPRADDLIETMVALYGRRAIGEVWPLQEELWREAGFDPASLAAFKAELITVRNINMRNAAAPLLAQGGAFIAVGALHLPGPDGLVELFRQSGYTATAIE